MKTAALLLVFAAIAALDLPALIRRGKAKPLIVYGSIFLLALVLSELQILRVSMWSPNRAIEEAVHWIVPAMP